MLLRSLQCLPLTATLEGSIYFLYASCASVDLDRQLADRPPSANRAVNSVIFVALSVVRHWHSRTLLRHFDLSHVWIEDAGSFASRPTVSAVRSRNCVSLCLYTGRCQSGCAGPQSGSDVCFYMKIRCEPCPYHRQAAMYDHGLRRLRT